MIECNPRVSCPGQFAGLENPSQPVTELCNEINGLAKYD